MIEISERSKPWISVLAYQKIYSQCKFIISGKRSPADSPCVFMSDYGSWKQERACSSNKFSTPVSSTSRAINNNRETIPLHFCARRAPGRSPRGRKIIESSKSAARCISSGGGGGTLAILCATDFAISVFGAGSQYMRRLSLCVGPKRVGCLNGPDNTCHPACSSSSPERRVCGRKGSVSVCNCFGSALYQMLCRRRVCVR